MDEIVFVMEDVDAASNVVYARDGARPGVPAVPDGEPIHSGADVLGGDHLDPTSTADTSEPQNDSSTSGSTLSVPAAVRTASAPAWRATSGATLRTSSGGNEPSLISEERKAGILREMARWDAEDDRAYELPFKAQIARFFKQAEVRAVVFLETDGPFFFFFFFCEVGCGCVPTATGLGAGRTCSPVVLFALRRAMSFINALFHFTHGVPLCGCVHRH